MVVTNGKIVTPERILDGHDLVLEEDRITAIHGRESASDGSWSGRNGVEYLDAGGGYVIPGLIDLHADYIEHMAAPRPVSVMDFSLSLWEAERELITHGITTMFHSLSLYSFTEFAQSPLRTPENTRKLIELIEKTHHRLHLIRHRFHARFEIDNLDRVEELVSYIERRVVHLISFMDHTPGQGQYRNLEIYRTALKSYRNVSDEEVDRIITVSRDREKLTIAAIGELARLAREHSIAVASHDDDSVEKLDLVRSLGAGISEFPTTLEVAREARRRGLHTVAGAPNILLGGSHSGNLSAAEAILDGAVDVLCSDYYPAAMLHAVFYMHRAYGLPLPDMVRLVTKNAAEAVLLGDDFGSLEVGKKADLLVVRQIDEGFPAVTDAVVDGRRVFSTSYRE
jgi:alpha-D-ribose 1-methylphosphonate 5-triphosphate diphosphatase